MKAYIAGPMTGYEHHNFPAFFEAEKLLVSEGYSVVNPAKNRGGDTWEEALANHDTDPLPWEWYLRVDLKSMLDCDWVAVLPNWQLSKGAVLEVQVATAVGIPIDYSLVSDPFWKRFVGKRLEEVTLDG